MSLPSQSLLNGGLGALMIGMCVNLMLFSQETTLLISLFRADRKDSLAMKLGLAFMYVVDAGGTAVEIICVYYYCVTHWGDQTYLIQQDWTMPAIFICTGFSALFCQSFLVHRIFRLTRSVLFAAVLFTLSLASFGGAIAAAVTLLTHREYAQRAANVVPVTIWLLCSAVADVAIAVILSAFLWRARRTVSKFDGSRLHGPLTKALHQTLECGGVVTAAALAALAVYLHSHTTNISIGIGFILGRSYALTVIYCLSQKGSHQPDASITVPASSVRNKHAASSFWDRGRGTKTGHGVTVHEETIVAHDVGLARGEEGEAHYELGRIGRDEHVVPVDPRLYMVGAFTPEPAVEEEKEVGRAYSYI